MKPATKTSPQAGNSLGEIKKAQFVKIVSRLADLRDLQYEMVFAAEVVARAEKLVALNLPSNLLRAAAILVDWMYGFPPHKKNFDPPKWVTSTNLLPRNQRGSLACKFKNDITDLEQNDIVILINDLAEEGLCAGMSGIIREMPSETDGDDDYLIEFGAPEDHESVKIVISSVMLRPPRPGDLIENYRV